jgi:hypothetical protein
LIPTTKLVEDDNVGKRNVVRWISCLALKATLGNNHVVEVRPIERHIILLHNTLSILHFPKDCGKVKPPFS